MLAGRRCRSYPRNQLADLAYVLSAASSGQYRTWSMTASLTPQRQNWKLKRGSAFPAAGIASDLRPSLPSPPSGGSKSLSLLPSISTKLQSIQNTASDPSTKVKKKPSNPHTYPFYKNVPRIQFKMVKAGKSPPPPLPPPHQIPSIKVSPGLPSRPVGVGCEHVCGLYPCQSAAWHTRKAQLAVPSVPSLTSLLASLCSPR